MADPNRILLERVVQLLRPLLDELVFVGGCVTGLLITDTASAGARPTRDVDAIAEVSSYVQHIYLSERLRGLGLASDTTEGAPICRWLYEDLMIDVMPTDERVLGFSNQWYVSAIRTAQTIVLGGAEARVIAPAHFIATKIEAFHGRGKNDALLSPDIEDLIMVIDGRPEIVYEIRDSDDHVRTFIATEIGRLIQDRSFMDMLSGFLSPDAGSQARRPLLEARLRSIAALVGGVATIEE